MEELQEQVGTSGNGCQKLLPASHGDNKSLTSGNGCQKLWNRDSLGEEYGLSGRTVANLLRVNALIPELKSKVDLGELPFVAAVGMSYLSAEEQRLTLQNKTMPGAEQVKQLRAEAGNLTEKKVAAVVNSSDKVKSVSIKISEKWQEKYFAGMEKKQIVDVIEKALEMWAVRGETVDC